jgi:3-hydroxyisobutyrate dehydrogenase-like beta-hydroxyacid dehydrogenase
MTDKPAIGFVGLGMMGSGMAGCLMAAGHPLMVASGRASDAVERFRASGARVVDDLGALAREARVIVTCLPDSPAVAEAAEVILPHLIAGTLWIDATTADPRASRGLANLVAERGAAFADAPVTGGPSEAAAGRLASLVGCAEGDWAGVQAIVGTYSVTVRRFGEVGTGHFAKLLNNLVTQGTTALLAEAYGAARKAGVDWQALFDVMSTGAARSGTLEKAVGPALSGDYDGARFSIRNAAKDLTYAADLLAGMGRPSPIAEAARDRMKQAVDLGHGARFVSRLLDPDTAGATQGSGGNSGCIAPES